MSFIRHVCMYEQTGQDINIKLNLTDGQSHASCSNYTLNVLHQLCYLYGLNPVTSYMIIGDPSAVHVILMRLNLHDSVFHSSHLQLFLELFFESLEFRFFFGRVTGADFSGERRVQIREDRFLDRWHFG